MLKSYLLGGVVCVMVLPSWAETPSVRAPSRTPDTLPQVVSVSMDSMGPRQPAKLRETLRQTDNGSSANALPYRLTPQERQRLREQLRQQTWSAQASR